MQIIKKLNVRHRYLYRLLIQRLPFTVNIHCSYKTNWSQFGTMFSDYIAKWNKDVFCTEYSLHTWQIITISVNGVDSYARQISQHLTAIITYAKMKCPQNRNHTHSSCVNKHHGNGNHAIGNQYVKNILILILILTNNNSQSSSWSIAWMGGGRFTVRMRRMI